MVSPSTPAASTALVTAFLISRRSRQVIRTSAVSCQVTLAFAAASAAPSLASVDEIHVLRAASMMSR
jgi:hypothetical protein